MEVFGPVSDKANPDEVIRKESLLGLASGYALPASLIVDQLRSATPEQVAEVVDRHLWVRFYGDCYKQDDRPALSHEAKEAFLLTMGVQIDSPGAERRIKESVLSGNWQKVNDYIGACLEKIFPSDNKNPSQSFCESKDDWYARYCERQAAITYNYAQLVAQRILDEGWLEEKISPVEFIYVAKPLSYQAARNAGYYKADRAAKSSIRMLGTIVSDNYWAAAVKERFLKPYFDRVRALEQMTNSSFF